jgi:hypothetical protein
MGVVPKQLRPEQPLDRAWQPVQQPPSAHGTEGKQCRVAHASQQPSAGAVRGGDVAAIPGHVIRSGARQSVRIDETAAKQRAPAR